GTRYLLNKLQQNYIATYSDTDFGLRSAYTVNGLETKKEEIRVGDRITLFRGQTLPVKGKILSTHADWNLSLMSGESYPRAFHKEMEIDSGAILISESCELEVLEVYSNSRILGIKKSLDKLRKEKGEFVQFTDRFS